MEAGSDKRQEVGRYSLFRELASGGMATVYLGRLNAAGGFGRIVAVKRLHAQLARDPEFVAMFLDEARLAARIHHPNVVSTLDVVSDEGELFVVMDYVRGESLSNLWRAMKERGERMPRPMVTSVVGGLLHGLHAAHNATDEQGEPLGIVHRDVSPQNVIVGVDGSARVLDFGVAKAASRLQQTRDGQLKGKLGYMAPEQISEEVLDRRCDIYAAGIVLWEMLTGRFLFRGKTDGETLRRVLERRLVPPSRHVPEVSAELDAVALRALEPNRDDRFASAREMALALERAERGASTLEVGEWVQSVAERTLEARHAMVRSIESGSIDSLSGFPAIPAGLLAPDRPSGSGAQSASLTTAGSAGAGTEARLVTAVTVHSDRTAASNLHRPSRWPWIAGVAGAALLTAGLLVGRQLSRNGSAERAAPAETPDLAASMNSNVPAEPPPTVSAPVAGASASSPTEPTATSGASAGAGSSPGTGGNTSTGAAATSPSPSPSRAPSPPAATKPRATSNPTAQAGSGNDLDSLIETRK